MEKEGTSMELKIYRVRKVIEQFEKGLITESEMWKEIDYTANYAIAHPTPEPIHPVYAWGGLLHRKILGLK